MELNKVCTTEIELTHDEVLQIIANFVTIKSGVQVNPKDVKIRQTDKNDHNSLSMYPRLVPNGASIKLNEKTGRNSFKVEGVST